MDTYKSIRGATGAAGSDGKNGKTPYIQDGYWYIDGVNTNVKAEGEKGNDYILTLADKVVTAQLAADMVNVPTVVQEAGESESLVMSQKAVTDLVSDALGSGGTTEYETVDSIEQMTDTSKPYVLSTDGYIYTYTEKTETIKHEAQNKFVASEAQINKRMGSSSLSAQDGFVWTGAMAVDLTKESPFRVKVEGTLITEYNTTVSVYQKIWLCEDNTGSTKLSAATLMVGDGGSNAAPLSEDGIIHADYKGGAKLSDSIITSTKYIRIGFKFSDSAITNTSALSGVKITFPCEAYTEEVTTSAWVSTGMKPSASGGGGNYVDLLVKVNQNKTDIAEVSNRVTAIENGSNSVTVPSFWQSAVDVCISKIKSLQVGRNCVTFPFFSDNHQRNGYAGMLIAHIMKECNIPYCFYGGDSISSDVVADEATMIAQDKAFDTMMSYVPNGRMCRAVGNHDGYWYDGTNKYYYNREQIYELFLREESIAQNKHFGGNGTYYYVDDIASKVRFIVLNTNVHRNTNGTIEGNNIEAEQLSWLQNTALSFNESGWAVVFISHQPISNHYHANISNASEVISAVSAYINGSSANKAVVVGWFSGHIHRDRIYTGVAVNTTDDSIGTAIPFKQVTITSDHTSIAYDDTTKHTVANDDKSHAIDFVTINKSTRTVNITRLGIGNDRSYTY
jgi:hypothetical protein